jgi:hypothetical protein
VASSALETDGLHLAHIVLPPTPALPTVAGAACSDKLYTLLRFSGAALKVIVGYFLRGWGHHSGIGSSLGAP